MGKKLRVWWIPQVPGKPFYVPVEDELEAVKVMALLACYDCFQWNQNIKPDYCNVGGLEMWDEEEQDWVEWYYEDECKDYEDVEEYCKECLSNWDASAAFQSELYKQVHF